MDNIFSERQQRLLTESLYASWAGPGEGRPFLALANVGLFYSVHQPALVPDIMVSLDVRPPGDVWLKPNRSYFLWEYGKPPEVVIEIVSNRKGGELDDKLLDYARLGIAHYIVYDPDEQISEQPLHIFTHHGPRYVEISDGWLNQVGLGVTLWKGDYEGVEGIWLRWCDADGKVLATGVEAATRERQRAEHLAAKLRALGVDPDA